MAGFGQISFAVIMIASWVGAVRAQSEGETSIALPGPSLTYSTTYLAIDLGLFSDLGIKAKIVDVAGADATQDGGAEWMLLTGGGFSSATLRGQKLRVVASLLERPQMEIVLKKTLADQAKFDARAPLEARGKLLKGRSIGVDGALMEMQGWAQFVARKAGLDVQKDIKFVAMAPAAMAAALASGAIDGFSASAPWTTGVARAGTGVILASAPAGDAPDILPFAYSVLASRPQLCETRKSVCEKVAKAYVEATRIMRDEPLRTTLVLRNRFPQTPDAVLNASIDTIRRSTPIFPGATAESLANAAAFNVKSGMLKPDEVVKSFEGLFTNEFIR